METPQDPSPTTRQRLAHGFLALVGVCVLYPASVGPVLVLYWSTGFPSTESLVMFYAPLGFVAEKTSTGNYFVDYQSWWYRTFRPKEGYKAEHGGP